jgi:hypothetical protein
MGEGGSEWDTYAGWADLEETAWRSAPKLVRGLEETWSLLAPCLER